MARNPRNVIPDLIWNLVLPRIHRSRIYEVDEGIGYEIPDQVWNDEGWGRNDKCIVLDGAGYY